MNSLEEACRRRDITYTKYKKTKHSNNVYDVLAQEAIGIAVDETKLNTNDGMRGWWQVS